MKGATGAEPPLAAASGDPALAAPPPRRGMGRLPPLAVAPSSLPPLADNAAATGAVAPAPLAKPQPLLTVFDGGSGAPPGSNASPRVAPVPTPAPAPATAEPKPEPPPQDTAPLTDSAEDVLDGGGPPVRVLKSQAGSGATMSPTIAMHELRRPASPSSSTEVPAGSGASLSPPALAHHGHAATLHGLLHVAAVPDARTASTILPMEFVQRQCGTPSGDSLQVSSLVADSRGLRGVLLRLVVSRGVAPEGGCAGLVEHSVPVPHPRWEDHLAALIAVLWTFSPVLVAVVPIATNGTGRMDFGPALLFGALSSVMICGLAVVTSMGDAFVGGLHPERLPKPLQSLLMPLVPWALWIALLLGGVGPFPLLHLVTTLGIPVFSLPMRQLKPPPERVKTVKSKLVKPLNRSILCVFLAVGLYYWVMANTSHTAARIAVGLGFDLAIYYIKQFTRNMGGALEATVIIGDGWPEGLATVPQLLMFALSDLTTVAFLLVAQLGGGLAPVFWAWRFAGSSSADAASEPLVIAARRVAVLRVGLSIASHIACGATLMAVVYAARRGPNAADLAYGTLSAAQEEQLFVALALWLVTFAVYFVVVRDGLRWLWGIDMGQLLVDSLYRHTPYVLRVSGGVQCACVFLVYKQMQMLWWVFPEDGMSH